MPSQATENYLKAIYKLALRKDPVMPSEVVRGLKVSAASASNMMKKLAEEGYLTHHPYHGVSLTAAGKNLALHIIRNHRVLELYLSKVLGLTWDEVDNEAEALEHLVSDRLVEAMDSALDYPRFDPHGSPIPSADGEIPETLPARRLTELKPGEGGRVTRVESASDEMLRYLGELKIYPDTRIEVLERAPFGGPVMLHIGETEAALGTDLAHAIYVAVED